MFAPVIKSSDVVTHYRAVDRLEMTADHRMPTRTDGWTLTRHLYASPQASQCCWDYVALRARLCADAVPIKHSSMFDADDSADRFFNYFIRKSTMKVVSYAKHRTQPKWQTVTCQTLITHIVVPAFNERQSWHRHHYINCTTTQKHRSIWPNDNIFIAIWCAFVAYQ